jgi:xylan 1,4-beta-xylosidase
MFRWILLCGALAAMTAGAAAQVTVRVDVDKPLGPLTHAWSWFGYDEPNYTYSPNGQKLLHELAQADSAPVYMRTHNLFTSGDGTGSLKWGSTNVYTEDAKGRPVYDWTIVDRIFDAYRDAGVRPLVEIGFMPEAMTTGPAPYRHSFPHGSIFTGWSYPPKDYAKWGELVFRFAEHLRRRYGDAAVKTWLWEVWNEPDIPYWHGTPEEYFRLYDVSVDAVRRAVPFATIGGPDSTAPSGDKAAAFLRAFLEHCARGKNYATGKTGAPLDFISFHPKGKAQWVDGHVRMGLAQQLQAADDGFKIVASFPQWRNTPVVLGENDPESCAGCSPKDNPEDNYRNRSIYAAYNVTDVIHTMAAAERRGVTLKGMVTWAFQFDGQSIFAGFRDLATDGIDKPVLNGFRALGKLGDTRLTATSSRPATQVEQNGVPQPVVETLAARGDRAVSVLLDHYRDDDIATPDAAVALTLAGLPPEARQVTIERFRVDGTHGNAFTAWQAMGSPTEPSPEQYKRLSAAGQLQPDGAVQHMPVPGGILRLDETVPIEGLELIRIAW